ncbi:hypothetical protein CDAR_403261 [Caerostris darwini]|uniref:Uncharacterized protein n=1 Tax=Caerostris darwini TaxID=1538125 RepID=A0AAV4S4U3_9ARAC|nr:hypothetical protein CDAR_403261 [Caerostris darwini]
MDESDSEPINPFSQKKPNSKNRTESTTKATIVKKSKLNGTKFNDKVVSSNNLENINNSNLKLYCIPINDSKYKKEESCKKGDITNNMMLVVKDEDVSMKPSEDFMQKHVKCVEEIVQGEHQKREKNWKEKVCKFCNGCGH